VRRQLGQVALHQLVGFALTKTEGSKQPLGEGIRDLGVVEFRVTLEVL
jgi:hypothetical protein